MESGWNSIKPQPVPLELQTGGLLASVGTQVDNLEQSHTDKVQGVKHLATLVDLIIRQHFSPAEFKVLLHQCKRLPPERFGGCTIPIWRQCRLSWVQCTKVTGARVVAHPSGRFMHGRTQSDRWMYM